MKVLTLTQPWATLVAMGAKRVETRSWSTSYRGDLAIHAAKGFPRDCIDLCFTEPFRQWLKGMPPKELPRGEIICVARLQDVVPTTNVLTWISDEERAFGNYAAGRFAWVFGARAVPLELAIACRGALGLWAPGDEIRGQLVAQGWAA